MRNTAIRGGWCDGGPLANKQLAHDGDTYRITQMVPITAEMEQAIRTLSRHGLIDETTVPKLYPADGEYTWDGGVWRWAGTGS